MNFPSRGLRLSVTTIRNTGVFLAPTLFIRILTAIKIECCFAGLQCQTIRTEFVQKRAVNLVGGVQLCKSSFWLFLRRALSAPVEELPHCAPFSPLHVSWMSPTVTESHSSPMPAAAKCTFGSAAFLARGLRKP